LWIAGVRFHFPRANDPFLSKMDQLSMEPMLRRFVFPNE
jgi:hypothetical protein